MNEANMKLAVLRSDALFNFYQAERRQGADSLTAHERMVEFAKRFDDSEYERDLEVIRQALERTS